VQQVKQKTSTMAQHINTGKTGEYLAAEWLEKNGFTIIQRNWRHHRYEVDIIAGRSSILHFIEVKTRRSKTFGNPEESVSRKKLEHVMEAATGWLHRWPAYRRVRYDVLAVTLLQHTSPEFVLFEDVYL
jgi:putative endonuclease